MTKKDGKREEGIQRDQKFITEERKKKRKVRSLKRKEIKSKRRKKERKEGSSFTGLLSLFLFVRR